MKHLLAAAACAPLLVACASAGAQTGAVAADDEAETRILIVNGQRIVLDDHGNAALAIEEALEGEDGRLRLELRNNGEWTPEQREAFAEAMAALGARFGEDFANSFHFEFDADDAFTFDMSEFDEEDVRVFVRRAERDAERAERLAERIAERAERHAERVARQAETLAFRVERNALRAELMGQRMAVHGLRAGVLGIESGIDGIDEVLERGWYYDDGERVELDADKRADLEETREELADDLVDLREELEEMEARLGASHEHRRIRIERHDGSVRAWVNGEEVRGSELDELLGDMPDAPEPPEPPLAPGDE